MPLTLFGKCNTCMELNQFVRNDIWTSNPRLDYVNVIGIKFIFKNKLMKLEILL